MTDDVASSARRRRRTEKYLAMWGVNATIPIEVVAVPADSLTVADVATVRGRALTHCLLALRGQGLSQLEAFAFADAYAVWDHLTFDENQFILSEEPTGDAMLQAAWRYERLWVLLWAFGSVRHLAFSDAEIDSAKAIETCVAEVALVSPASSEHPAGLQLRESKELLDAADVAWCSQVVTRASTTPMLPGVVHERAAAFDELLPGWRP